MHYIKKELIKQSYALCEHDQEEDLSMLTPALQEEQPGPHGMKHVYEGKASRVVHCKGALESLAEALARVTSKKGGSLVRVLIIQIQRLISGERMSKENFPQEGVLPKAVGQSKEKHFHAFKKIPIRAYCWSSVKHPNTWFISHYIYKDKDKLDSKDEATVGKNWNRIEVDGHES